MRLAVKRRDTFAVVTEGKKESSFWVSFLLEILAGRNHNHVASQQVHAAFSLGI